MRCPESIVLTDGTTSTFCDAIGLRGFTNEGEPFSIQKIQTNLPDRKDAGRLLFDSFVVPVRSEWEAEIISLLQSAEFADEPPNSGAETNSYTPGPITGSEPLRDLRDKLVSYLESDEYVEIATNGPKKSEQPWRPF